MIDIVLFFFSGNDSTLANDTVLRCCAGLCVDLLKILSTEMKFDYDFYEVPDQTWGLPDQVVYFKTIVIEKKPLSF